MGSAINWMTMTIHLCFKAGVTLLDFVAVPSNQTVSDMVHFGLPASQILYVPKLHKTFGVHLY